MLAGNAVDYLAIATDSSPVQHFWSLSVEEQFYFVWPALLLASVLVSRRVKGTARVGITLAVAGLCLGSLVYSVSLTHDLPAAAYFVTTTRVWEFAAGGLAAVWMSVPLRGALASTLVGWLGVAMIVVASLAYSGSTPFPGYAAAVPVAGTLLVIWAGGSASKLSFAALSRVKTVAFLGDTSYSIYLWHWPLIVLLPIIVGEVAGKPTLPQKLMIVVVSLALGWASKKYVEDRFRTPLSPPSAPKRKRAGSYARQGAVLAAVASGMAVVCAVGGIAWGVAAAGSSGAASEVLAFESKDLSCFGAGVLVDANCAGSSPTESGVVPNPLIARQTAPNQDCQQRLSRSEVIRCTFGSDGGPRVALVGDSHANQWLPPLISIADEKGWELDTYLKSGCTYTQAAMSNETCRLWNQGVASQLEADAYDLVIVSSVANLDYLDASGPERYAASVEGYIQAWAPLLAAGSRIAAIGDVPRPSLAGIPDPPTCVLEGRDCVFNEVSSTSRDPLLGAAQQEGSDTVTGIDVRPYFCEHSSCSSVIGGILVYRDGDHITSTYALSMKRFLDQLLPEVR
ncbi:acyltransferase 3 [Microbacterium laevaniformans OR221]|nr:acyltransferase 3 [Microbacterium laevaniformans OR221]